MFSYSFDFHPIKNPQGPVLAFADLTIEDTFKVVGFKIMQNTQTGELWVAPPQERSNKTDDAGKPVYFPRVYWQDSKPNEEAKRTVAENEVYTEMVKAYQARNQSDARQGAAAAHASRNQSASTSGSGGNLW